MAVARTAVGAQRFAVMLEMILFQQLAIHYPDFVSSTTHFL